MYPNFLYQYAMELWREREKALLNLVEGERLIRKARLMTNSNNTKLPNVNLYGLVQAFGKRIFQLGKEDSTTLHTEVNCCKIYEPLQQQNY